MEKNNNEPTHWEENYYVGGSLGGVEEAGRDNGRLRTESSDEDRRRGTCVWLEKMEV